MNVTAIPLPLDYQHRAYNFFAYEADVINLAASGTGTAQFTAGNDSDFLVLAAVARVSANATPETPVDDPGITATVKNDSTGVNLNSGPTPIRNLFGTALRPAYWPAIFPVPGGSTVSVDFSNLVATAYDLYLTFWGLKVYGRMEEIPDELLRFEAEIERRRAQLAF